MNEGLMAIIVILSIVCGIVASKSSKKFIVAAAPLLTAAYGFMFLAQEHMILSTIASVVISVGAMVIGRKL